MKHKILYILFLLFVSGQLYAKDPYPKFTRADSLHGYLSEFRSCYDVRFYDIAVTVKPETKSLEGKVSMLVSCENPQQSVIQIDVSSLLTIDSLFIDSVLVTNYKREHNAVFFSLPQVYEKGQEYTITCSYHGKPAEAVRPPWEAGMVWKTSESGKPWCGVTCETLGASCWIPCKDHLSDEPEDGMRMKITVPKGLVAVSNGMLQEHIETDANDVWIWKTNYPINSYNMTFYVGDFVSYEEEYKGIERSFPLIYWVLQEDLEKSKKSFAQTKDVVAAYEEFFGPYPWSKECLKLVESPYEGMEHQTAIAYGNGFKNTFGFDYIIVHEVAHEWWGNTVSVDDYAEIFIHEGFAMYSEFLYVEKMFGTEKRDRYIRIWANTLKNIRPVVGPRDVNFWDYRDTDPYVKGALTLHGLRDLIDNDSLFFDIIKSYNMTRRNSIVTVKDFTDYVNERTGQDYSWYFKQYLYSKEKPVLQVAASVKLNEEDSVYVVENGSRKIFYNLVKVRWVNVDDSFHLPISFVVSDSSSVQVSGLNCVAKHDKVVPTTDGVFVAFYSNEYSILFSVKRSECFDVEFVKKFKKKK